jgi:hypothetical protein
MLDPEDTAFERARSEMRLEDQAITGALILGMCLAIVVIAVGIVVAIAP